MILSPYSRRSFSAPAILRLAGGPATPEMLGFRPDRTGATDESSRLSDYIATLLTKGYDGNFGAGNFLFASPIPIVVPETADLNLKGAGHYNTRFTCDDDGVTVTAVSTGGGAMSDGTVYLMVFGLDAGNVVQGAWAPRQGTVASPASNALRITWPAIAGATKYRIWVGATRFLQTSYFEVSGALTYDVEADAGTADTRPDWDFPLFDVTLNADFHPIWEDFSVNGSNRCSSWIKYDGGASYVYGGRHTRIWARYFYGPAAKIIGQAAWTRWDHCVHRTAEKGWYLEDAADHQWQGCDAGECDYGWDLVDSVGNEILFPNGYTNNFAAIRFQAGANRNNVIGGTLNLNKQAGIILAGEQNELAFTKFAGNSDLLTNTYSDIVVTGDANTLTKPKFIPDAGGKLPKYNIEITGAITLECTRPQPKGTTWGTDFCSDYTKVVGMENVYERLLPGVNAGGIGMGACISTTQAVVFVPYAKKRKVPAAITTSGGFELRHGGGTTAVTGLSWTPMKHGANVTVTVASGLTAGSGCVLRTASASGDVAYVTLDAR